jgi:hypothetical protein
MKKNSWRIARLRIINNECASSNLDILSCVVCSLASDMMPVFNRRVDVQFSPRNFSCCRSHRCSVSAAELK